MTLCVLIKPLNASVEWAWRTAQLPSFDSIQTMETLTYDKSPDFNKPIQKGDAIMGFEVTSGFGLREAPISGASTDHKGIDLATPEGTPLYVIGNVSNKDGFTGYGDVFCDNDFMGVNKEGVAAYVTVPNFPNIEFVYWHLKPNTCVSGRLPVGSKFAETGNSGNSSGAHLHFGMRVTGDWAKLNFKSEWQHPITGALRWSLEGKEPEKPTTKPIVERLRKAIAAQESNHNPKAINPDSKAQGYGQVMPENIKEWSTQCLGQPLTKYEFINSKEKQIKIIDCKLTEYLEHTAPMAANEDEQIRKVASMWYSGKPHLYDDPTPQTYGTGSYPSIREYTTTVLERFKKQ